VGQANTRGSREERVRLAKERQSKAGTFASQRRQAVGQLIADFNKRYQTKVCLAPHAQHDGPIVSAHTLSVEAALRPISREGRVYAVRQQLSSDKEKFPISLELRGLRDVSVFNGFCRGHDRDLFACLETTPLVFSAEQVFMLAYRAVARESYYKRKQLESFPSPERYAAVHGLTEPVQFSKEAENYVAQMLAGAEDIERLTGRFDGLLLAKNWNRLVTRVLVFPEKPSLSVSFAFQPSVTLNGERLQVLTDTSSVLSHLMVSVLPVHGGGAAVFSWLDTANSAPERFYRSIAQADDVTSAVIHMALDISENVAISPDWYDGLPPDSKWYIAMRLLNMLQDEAYEAEGNPLMMAPPLGAWGTPRVLSVSG